MGKTCTDLFAGIDCTVIGNADEEVGGIAYRSDRVQPGDAFFCIVGLTADGHSFAQDAIDRGAKAVSYTHLIARGMGVRLLRRGRRCASEGIGLVTKRMFHVKHSFAYPIFRLFSPLPCCCQAWPALPDGGPGSARAQPSPGAHLPPLWLRPAPPLPRLNEQMCIRDSRNSLCPRVRERLAHRARRDCCGRCRVVGRWDVRR